VGPLRRLCRLIVQRGPRVLVVAVGLALIGIAVLGDHSDTLATALLVLGVLLVIAGALLPYVEEVAVGVSDLNLGLNGTLTTPSDGHRVGQKGSTALPRQPAAWFRGCASNYSDRWPRSAVKRS